METFSALLAFCAGNSPATGEFPAQRLMTRSFDVFFDPRLNKRLSKQSWGWWFETQSGPFWRHCSVKLQWVKILFVECVVDYHQSREATCTKADQELLVCQIFYIHNKNSSKILLQTIQEMIIAKCCSTVRGLNVRNLFFMIIEFWMNEIYRNGPLGLSQLCQLSRYRSIIMKS